MTQSSLDEKKSAAQAWFRTLRDEICSAFEAVEADYDGALSDQPAGRFERKSWDRETEDGTPGGGGVMSVMKGRVFEKVGVNISTVSGAFSKEFAKTMPGAEEDPSFFATGISLVSHMRSPLVPAAHMNTRFIVTSKEWFGGGADLNAPHPDPEETAKFHAALKAACDDADPEYYPRYKEECDRYFYIPHRNKARGEGGIFYDYLNSGDWDADFAFTRAVGAAFRDIYPALIREKFHLPWTDAQRETQLRYRGHYAEFNLVYDRGTLFGLKTGGNIEAILMSLPPEAKWP